MSSAGLSPDRAAAPGVVATTSELIALGRVRFDPGEARRRRVATRASGSKPSRFHGRGMEFAELREYQPGDDIRTIDWRVTARTGRPHSKRFEEERERPLWLLVDLGPSMRFGTRGAFKSVAAARAASLVAWAAHRAGERVGGVIATCGETLELPPGRTRRDLLRFLGALAAGTASGEEAPAHGVAEPLRRLAPRLRGGSRVVVMSDFYGYDEAAAEALRVLARRCEVTLVHVFDALEQSAPPPGRYRVSDGQAVRTLSAGRTSAWQQAVAEVFGGRCEVLRALAVRHRMSLVRLRTDAAPTEALAASRGAA